MAIVKSKAIADAIANTIESMAKLKEFDHMDYEDCDYVPIHKSDEASQRIIELLNHPEPFLLPKGE